MKWCCPGFQANYRRRSDAGFSIVVGRDPLGAPMFSLRYRVFPRGQEESLLGRRPIVADLGMRFCPWCGRDLEKAYGSQLSTLYSADDSPPFDPVAE